MIHTYSEDNLLTGRVQWEGKYAKVYTTNW